MKATKIIAKRKSMCPGCAQSIYPGVPCQVYNNKWYHIECWQTLWDKIAEEKDKSKEIPEDKYISLEEQQKEYANEIRGIGLQIEVLSGRLRNLAKEMGSW